MAEICDNYLFVRGPTPEVEVFILNHLDVTDDEGFAWLDLDSIIPYPARFRRLDVVAERWAAEHEVDPTTGRTEQPEDGFNQGGRAWCTRNWGTKWNTYAYEAGNFAWELDDERRASAQLCFSTAWAPVSKRVLLVLSRLYPGCTFELRYAEPAHRGRVRTRGGKVLVETRYKRRWTGDMTPPGDF